MIVVHAGGKALDVPEGIATATNHAEAIRSITAEQIDSLSKAVIENIMDALTYNLEVARAKKTSQEGSKLPVAEEKLLKNHERLLTETAIPMLKMKLEDAFSKPNQFLESGLYFDVITTLREKKGRLESVLAQIRHHVIPKLQLFEKSIIKMHLCTEKGSSGLLFELEHRCRTKEEHTTIVFACTTIYLS